MTQKHRWTLEEDKYCCKKYIELFVEQKSNLTTSEFIQILSSNLSEIKLGSLRMKAQNIKQILIEKGISDSLQISPSTNYSKQNYRAMESVLKEYYNKNSPL